VIRIWLEREANGLLLPLAEKQGLKQWHDSAAGSESQLLSQKLQWHLSRASSLTLELSRRPRMAFKLRRKET
jgi:hypothetical protein